MSNTQGRTVSKRLVVAAAAIVVVMLVGLFAIIKPFGGNSNEEQPMAIANSTSVTTPPSVEVTTAQPTISVSVSTPVETAQASVPVSASPGAALTPLLPSTDSGAAQRFALPVSTATGWQILGPENWGKGFPQEHLRHMTKVNKAGCGPDASTNAVGCPGFVVITGDFSPFGSAGSRRAKDCQVVNGIDNLGYTAPVSIEAFTLAHGITVDHETLSRCDTGSGQPAPDKMHLWRYKLSGGEEVVIYDINPRSNEPLDGLSGLARAATLTG